MAANAKLDFDYAETAISDDAVPAELGRLRAKCLTPDEADDKYDELTAYWETGDPRADPLILELEAYEGSPEAVVAEVKRRSATRYGGQTHISQDAPYRVAKKFLAACYREDQTQTLWCHNGEFWRWEAGVYLRCSLDEVKGKLYFFLESHCRTHDNKAIDPGHPTTALIWAFPLLRPAAFLAG